MGALPAAWGEEADIYFAWQKFLYNSKKKKKKKKPTTKYVPDFMTQFS